MINFVMVQNTFEKYFNEYRNQSYIIHYAQGPILRIGINFNPSMDK